MTKLQNLIKQDTKKSTILISMKNPRSTAWITIIRRRKRRSSSESDVGLGFGPGFEVGAGLGTGFGSGLGSSFVCGSTSHCLTFTDLKQLEKRMGQVETTSYHLILSKAIHTYCTYLPLSFSYLILTLFVMMIMRIICKNAEWTNDTQEKRSKNKT